MLYAVSIETTQVLPAGRARRLSRVFVDALNGDEAGRLAARRFRNRPEIKGCVVRGVARVAQAAPAQARGDTDTDIDMRGAMAASRGRRAMARKRLETSWPA